MKTPRLENLFPDELADMYDADDRLTEALTKPAKIAAHGELREAYEWQLLETKGHAEAMNATLNRLPSDTRNKSVELLNGTVADLFDLYARTKQVHRNWQGDTFSALHKLLDEFAVTIQNHIDLAAERATALGCLVRGTLCSAVKQSRLKKSEEPASKTGQRDRIRELADAHAVCSRNILAATQKVDEAGDFASTDLLVDILCDLNKQFWILESHLDQ